jgi:hypothetical protein
MSVTEHYPTLPGKRYPERYPLPTLKGNGNGNAPESLAAEIRYPSWWVPFSRPTVNDDEREGVVVPTRTRTWGYTQILGTFPTETAAPPRFARRRKMAGKWSILT